jgi:Pentatricopeptide repeat domain
MSKAIDGIPPLADTVSLNLFIEGIRRSQASPKEIMTRCETILKDIPSNFSTQPDDFTFELMAKIWNAVQSEANTRRADPGGVGSRAQALFERLYRNAVFKSGHRVDTRKSYFLGVPALSPSVATYSALIEVWCREDPERALSILDRMSQVGLAPHYTVYAKLLHAYSFPILGSGVHNIRSNQSVCAERLSLQMCRDRCDEVLSRMLADGYKPDPESCRLLLAVHAGVDSADSAERVDGVLQRLSQSGVKLDSFMLSSQLQAWGSSKSLSAPRKAEAAFAAGTAAGVSPSVDLYNLLIGIHGKSAQVDAPEVRFSLEISHC